MQTLLLLYAAALGLIVGSYLNVVIHRLPRRESTVTPRSRCPHCSTLIRARDNVPVLSFLLLGGRCRDCHSPISWRYPLIELLTSVCFVLSFQLYGFTAGGLIAAVFCALMIVLAGIDIDHLILPDRLTLPGIVLGLALHAWQPSWLPWATLREAAVGAVLGGGVLLAMSGLWYLLRRVEGMGLGDVKMLAMIGAFLGWKGVLVSLFLAALTGTLRALPSLLSGGLRPMHRLAFGPFLAFGAVIALLTGGGGLLDAYASILQWP